jgi:cyclic-di-GMP-binding protein
MASFDIVSKVDLQTLDNAINIVKKEITNRYDFKGSAVVIDLNKKDFKLNLEADSDMQLNQIVDVLISRSMRQGLEGSIYDLKKEPYQSGKIMKQEITIKNGLTKEDAKKVVELIKKAGLKVQAAIMDDVVRITGKKIDDLQEVIALVKGANLEFPTQYINMKS